MNYDRLILELMERVSVLEDEVGELKKKVTEQEPEDETYSNGSTDSAGRDTTKYILDGRKYGKNRLVLAVVKKYMKTIPILLRMNSLRYLTRVFKDHLVL